MKLKVDLYWRGGILTEEEKHLPPPEPEYELYDADTGKLVVDHLFQTCVELEAYINKHFPDCQRWAPPPPQVDEATRVERVLSILENPDPDRPIDPRYMRPFLVGRLYQSTYPPETVVRIRRALGLIK